MSIEREYIKQLLTELYNIESYQNLYEDLENKHTDLISEKNELYSEVKILRKNIKHLKEDVKKPAIISSMDIFSEIKKDEIIIFIKPTLNKKNKKYPSNPFNIELDNKGVVFHAERLGMWEIRRGNIYYYSVAKGSAQINNEIQKK